MKHPGVLPSEQDDIVTTFNYEGIVVIRVAVLINFPDSDRLRWLCHRLNSLK